MAAVPALIPRALSALSCYWPPQASCRTPGRSMAQRFKRQGAGVLDCGVEAPLPVPPGVFAGIRLARWSDTPSAPREH